MKRNSPRCAAELDTGPTYLKRRLCLEGSASEIFLRAAPVIRRDV